MITIRNLEYKWWKSFRNLRFYFKKIVKLFVYDIIVVST